MVWLVSGTLIADSKSRAHARGHQKHKTTWQLAYNVSGNKISVRHSGQLRYQALVSHGNVDASSVRAMINHDYLDESSGPWHFVEPRCHTLKLLASNVVESKMTNPIPERRTSNVKI